MSSAQPQIHLFCLNSILQCLCSSWSDDNNLPVESTSDFESTADSNKRGQPRSPCKPQTGNGPWEGMNDIRAIRAKKDWLDLLAQIPQAVNSGTRESGARFFVTSTQTCMIGNNAFGQIAWALPFRTQRSTRSFTKSPSTVIRVNGNLPASTRTTSHPRLGRHHSPVRAAATGRA